MTSVAKLILHVGMEAFGNQSSETSANRPEPNVESKSKVIFSILSTCLNCGGVEFLHAILPSSIILEPFVEACVDTVCTNGPMTCSALKILVLLKNIPPGMENLIPQKISALANCCMNIVLGGEFWDKSATLEEVCGPNSFDLIPEEDAFDILCRLPQPSFSAALAAALNDCPVSLDPSSRDHFKLFGILEPLLWLSNMPASIPEAHRALVGGEACEFLAKVIRDSPENWLWEDRGIWRLKGEAMTCLGNVIEKMTATELRSHITKEIIEAVAHIQDNMEAPLIQRDQAMYTLRRYKATASLRGMEPLCKDMLEAWIRLKAL